MIKFFLSLISLIFCANVASAQYYSQYGQDRWVNERIFLNKISGVFLDIGVHDGI
jgi:hypothetical protein